MDGTGVMINSKRQIIAHKIIIKYKTRKLPIYFYQEVARAFEGKCLSTLCQDGNDVLQFDCKRAHM